MSERQLETSLGPPLVLRDGTWVLTVGGLPVLHGLSVLSRALVEMVATQARSDRFDVAVERRLRGRENPELVDGFGLDLVKVVVEPSVVESIVARPEAFETRLRAVLGSLQRQRYRDALLPPDRSTSRALVAEFADDDGRCRIVVEHVPSRRDGRGALRITVEGDAGRRLDLASIPHLVVENAEDRHFIAGSTRIAQTWTEGLRREAERGRRSFAESRGPHSHLFRQLDQAGLGSLQRVSIQWPETAVAMLLESEPAEIAETCKRVLLALEDRNVRRLLAAREVLRIETGAVSVFLDISQLGRVLELSVGQRRDCPDVDAFLARMPVLHRIVERDAAARPLASTPVFLVHHMTGEVVGLIGALRALGCRDLTCLFVTYAGEPPASYLDAVLDLPEEEFRALALVNVPTPGSVEGHYRLSTQYSRLDERQDIERALQHRGQKYLDAMRAAAIVPFLRQLARAEQHGQRVLLIEDGGYLGPVLNDAMLRGATVREFAASLGHPLADERPLAAVASGSLHGCVEHTRNGFDRLTEVEAAHGRLALPAFSIAISRLKRTVEAREIAASILSAVESVLNADGRILSRRTPLVLGSRGAIGGELCRSLATRIDRQRVFGLDLKVAAVERAGGLTEATALAGLGEAWLDVDLVLGVTGDSVLGAADLERWLVAGTKQTLILASGSTKKVEFRALMAWFDQLVRSPNPTVGGRPVAVSIQELLDPRTARVYGHRWRFDFGAAGGTRTILALGNLTPINFLFYGAATELIDEVLAQLLSLSLGLLRRAGDPTLESRLCAVDRDVDADGRPIAAVVRG